MNMVEKVAEAIYESRRVRENRGSITFAQAVKNRRRYKFTYMVVEDCRHAARAAIEAMREPSKEMMRAMFEAMFEDKFDGTFAAMIGAGFEAAIDAALQEKAP